MPTPKMALIDFDRSDLVEEYPQYASAEKRVNFRWTGDTKFSYGKLDLLLQDYLQPDTDLNEAFVVKEILRIIPEKGSKKDEVSCFSTACGSMAAEIPYNHPSQMKLAYLLYRLSKYQRFRHMSFPKYKFDSDHSYPFYDLRIGIYDDLSGGPNKHWDPYFVNLTSFDAKLHSTGMNDASSGCTPLHLRAAFERLPSEDCDLSSEVVGAAQWVIWNGHNLFTELVHHDPDEVPNSRDYERHWSLGEKLQGSSMKPRSIERWRYWKKCFEEVASGEECNEECRKVSAKTAYLMDGIEKCLWYEPQEAGADDGKTMVEKEEGEPCGEETKGA